MAKVRDIITQLQNTEPVEPRGWFRWLHNHFLGRYPLYDANLEEQLAKQGWADLSRSLANLSARKRFRAYSSHRPPRLERGATWVDRTCGGRLERSQ